MKGKRIEGELVVTIEKRGKELSRKLLRVHTAILRLILGSYSLIRKSK